MPQRGPAPPAATAGGHSLEPPRPSTLCSGAAGRVASRRPTDERQPPPPEAAARGGRAASVPRREAARGAVLGRWPAHCRSRLSRPMYAPLRGRKARPPAAKHGVGPMLRPRPWAREGRPTVGGGSAPSFAAERTPRAAAATASCAAAARALAASNTAAAAAAARSRSSAAARVRLRASHHSCADGRSHGAPRRLAARRRRARSHTRRRRGCAAAARQAWRARPPLAAVSNRLGPGPCWQCCLIAGPVPAGRHTARHAPQAVRERRRHRPSRDRPRAAPAPARRPSRARRLGHRRAGLRAAARAGRARRRFTSSLP